VTTTVVRMTARTQPAPRTLADELRARSDSELSALLVSRPDLLNPVPADLAALVARAGTRASVLRAVDALDRFSLQVLEVFLAASEPSDLTVVRRFMGAGVDGVPLHRVDDAVRGLRVRALVWGPEGALRLVRTVREVTGDAPAGLGPWAVSALAAYPGSRLQDLLADLGLAPTVDAVGAAAAVAAVLGDERLAEVLAAAPPAARDVLDRLAWGPPVGRVEHAGRPVRAATARTPVEWLLAHGVVVASGPDTVVLPREVALHLRGGRLHRSVELDPPALSETPHDVERVGRTAASAALETVRRVEELLESWAVSGPAVLRAGGLGVRELRRAAGLLDVPEPTAALLAEVAYAAGLVGTSGDVDDVWLPTPAYDAWREQEAAHRWVALAAGWLETTRVAGLVGGRDDRDRPQTALAGDLDRPSAPDVRREVLSALAGLAPGAAADADALRALLRWRRPRRGGRLRDQMVGWTLGEGEALGLLGRGALAPYARPLLAGDTATTAAALAALLPRPLDHVLLQADLTAVAPGPLTRELVAELALLADVESTGGATVYRFGETSVRRALDAGRSADDVHRLLATHSRTPVPQPLSYLVDDVARRHGRIRVGLASAYVRCDDEAVLSELVAERRAAGLRLRRLAPTVVAAGAPVDAVLDRLRALGYAPMAESAEGDVLVSRPDSRRTPRRQRPPRLVVEPPAPGERLVAAAVRALRAGDRAAAARPVPDGQDGLLRRTSPHESLIALQTAAVEGRSLWIGYVDREGRASQRVIQPLSVEGGFVSAYDHTREDTRTFAVHRITGVATVDADAAAS